MYVAIQAACAGNLITFGIPYIMNIDNDQQMMHVYVLTHVAMGNISTYAIKIAMERSYLDNFSK